MGAPTVTVPGVPANCPTRDALHAAGVPPSSQVVPLLFHVPLPPCQVSGVSSVMLKNVSSVAPGHVVLLPLANVAAAADVPAARRRRNFPPLVWKMFSSRD